MVTVSVVQVRDGLEYRGDVTINGKLVFYRLTFAKPLPKLNAVLARRNGQGELPIAEKRELFRLELTQSGERIDAEDGVYLLLWSVVLPEVWSFYKDPQHRLINAGQGDNVAAMGSSRQFNIQLTRDEQAVVRRLKVH